MADLFEGAPQQWIHSTGDGAKAAVSKDVIDWVYRKGLYNPPAAKPHITIPDRPQHS